MGAFCSTGCPSGPHFLGVEAVTEPEPIMAHQQAWMRLGGPELEEALSKDWVRLIRATWLLDLAESGGILRRRQDLPPEAFIGLDELKQAGPAVLSNPFKSEEWLRIIVLSYPWLQPQHPDPHGENLRLIAKVLRHFVHDSWRYSNGGKPYGVLIDFTALPQASRTEQENEVFEQALPALNVFYSHPQTVVLKVTKLPEGYPSSSACPYDLPDGANTVAYAERGWCFAESAMSGLVKSSSKVLDLGGGLDHTGLHSVFHDCKSGRSPPLHPDDFKEQLNQKTFTSKRGDFDKVAKLYADAFQQRLGSAKELEYPGLGWDADAVRKFLRALQRNTSLELLDMYNNNIGPQGAAAFAQALQWHRSLRSLDLNWNNIGPQGAMALGEALQNNSSLQSLNLWFNNIGPQGAAALGQALQTNRSLQSLDLYDNNIGSQGAVALGHALESNSSLQVLNLRSNEIGPQGAVAMAEALQSNSSLQSLNLRLNNVGSQGAAAFGKALESNGSLQSLDLTRNNIGVEGAIALGQALKTNNGLQLLNLSENNVGASGAAAFGEALLSNNSLQSLNLSENNMGQQAAFALGEISLSRPTLKIRY